MTLAHPILDGKPKRLLIGGEWVDALSGATFPSVNPSTGEVIAELAEADGADADRAVAAARAAFDGPWSRLKPRQRQALLWAFADAVQEHYDELRLLEVLDMGSPIGRPRKPTSLAWEAEVLRYFAGWATKIGGETIPNNLPGAVFSYTLKEPVGVVVAWSPPPYFFVAPTVFADVRDHMRVAREEIFGPVACVLPFDSLEEAAARSNDTVYGLSGGVWTRDVGKAHQMARALRAGTVWVNTMLLFDPAVPFGGYGMSGWGREMGEHGLDEYLNVKSVWIDTEMAEE